MGSAPKLSHISFLHLPSEIRNLIYKYALVRSEPIDLWPHLYYGSADLLEVAGRDFDKSPYRVRRQESLDYVRKQMGTGLLGTCRQVHNEAAGYFWSENHFRFSGRSGWQGLLRFFLTIGPLARSRIRRVDVHAPIYMRWPGRKLGQDLSGGSKNHPKMHMVKIKTETLLDNEAKRRVCDIILKDRSLEEMNFVVPTDFRNGDEQNFGGYESNFVGDSDALNCIQKLEFVQLTVVFEKGSYLAVRNGVDGILRQGWDLMCMPGSFVFEKDESGVYVRNRVVETRHWSSPCRDWGLDRLFAEPDGATKFSAKHVNLYGL